MKKLAVSSNSTLLMTYKTKPNKTFESRYNNVGLKQWDKCCGRFQSLDFGIDQIIGNNNRLNTKLYERGDDLNFHDVKIPFLSIIYCLVLHMTFTFTSLSDMHGSNYGKYCRILLA